MNNVKINFLIICSYSDYEINVIFYNFNYIIPISMCSKQRKLNIKRVNENIRKLTKVNLDYQANNEI